jgi:4-oxalocrotonate tautomerase
MPVIKVELWTGRTKDQKAELAKAITDAVVNIAKTTPDETIVIFQDIDKENWSKAGVMASEW